MCLAETLTVKNFGPISNAEVEFRKYTLFTGEQGSGKSTIAKLYSLFSWLEKSLTRGSISVKYLRQYARFRKNYAAYNGLSSYFREDTEIEFQGARFHFHYILGSLEISENEDMPHNVAKVMYVPAERNIIGSTPHPSRLRGLSDPLVTFREAYDAARNAHRRDYTLPINGVRFEYDSLNDVPWVSEGDYRIVLSDASSGYQTVLPLLLVSRHLSEVVGKSSEGKGLSPKEAKSLQAEVSSLMQNKNFSEEVKEAMLKILSKKFSYSRFINIVEEPELNLFPSSQRKVLYELIADASAKDENKLVMTTHSPYILEYATLAVKASSLYKRANQRHDFVTRIERVVPSSSAVDAADLCIYEMGEGMAHPLPCDDVPSDDNKLNHQLMEGNDLFGELLEIEESLDNAGI